MRAQWVSPSCSLTHDVMKIPKLWAPPSSVKWRPTLWAHKMFEILNPIRPFPLWQRSLLWSRKFAHMTGNPYCSPCPQNLLLRSGACSPLTFIHPHSVNSAGSSTLTHSHWEQHKHNWLAGCWETKQRFPKTFFKWGEQMVSLFALSVFSRSVGVFKSRSACIIYPSEMSIFCCHGLGENKVYERRQHCKTTTSSTVHILEGSSHCTCNSRELFKSLKNPSM